MEVYGSVLVASFVGSLHCAGMCGPLAGFCSGSTAGGSAVSRDAIYHGARLAAYATLGVIGGALGSGLDLAGAQVGLGRVAAIVAGATMLVWGGTMLVGATGTQLPFQVPAGMKRALHRVLGRLQSRPPTVRALLLGLGSALLPCGWLYAFVLVAAGTGSVVGGAATMAAFWLGTVPALVGVSLGTRALAVTVARRLPVLGAAALLAVGVTTILSRMDMPTVEASPNPSQPTMPVEAPCHGH
jgi:sulfite exporter TauE/SafE